MAQFDPNAAAQLALQLRGLQQRDRGLDIETARQQALAGLMEQRTGALTQANADQQRQTKFFEALTAAPQGEKSKLLREGITRGDIQVPPELRIGLAVGNITDEDLLKRFNIQSGLALSAPQEAADKLATEQGTVQSLIGFSRLIPGLGLPDFAGVKRPGDVLERVAQLGGDTQGGIDNALSVAKLFLNRDLTVRSQNITREGNFLDFEAAMSQVRGLGASAHTAAAADEIKSITGVMDTLGKNTGTLLGTLESINAQEGKLGEKLAQMMLQAVSENMNTFETLRARALQVGGAQQFIGTRPGEPGFFGGVDFKPFEGIPQETPAVDPAAFFDSLIEEGIDPRTFTGEIPQGSVPLTGIGAEGPLGRLLQGGQGAALPPTPPGQPQGAGALPSADPQALGTSPAGPAAPGAAPATPPAAAPEAAPIGTDLGKAVGATPTDNTLSEQDPRIREMDKFVIEEAAVILKLSDKAILQYRALPSGQRMNLAARLASLAQEAVNEQQKANALPLASGLQERVTVNP